MSSKLPSFSEFLIERTLPNEFLIDVSGVKFNIVRSKHLRQDRAGDIKPKDFRMTEQKYQKIINLIKDEIVIGRVYTITWMTKDKSNAISLELQKDKIVIFGAIMRSNRDHDKLYPKAINRIHFIGNLIED